MIPISVFALAQELFDSAQKLPFYPVGAMKYKNSFRSFVGFVALAVSLLLIYFPNQSETASSQPLQNKEDTSAWTPVKIENSQDRPSLIRFQNGKTFVTTLFQVKYLGHLTNSGNAPFLILAGRGCQDCDANLAVYLHNPQSGPMQGEDSQERFVHPGVIRDAETKQAVLEARMFVGNCLPDVKDGVVWFIKEKDEQGRWKSSVLIAEVKNQELVVRELTTLLPDIKTVLANVKGNKCIEIKGINQITEP